MLSMPPFLRQPPWICGITVASLILYVYYLSIFTDYLAFEKYVLGINYPLNGNEMHVA